jgi:ABC-type phosphate transport system auxiliary subunit
VFIPAADPSNDEMRKLEDVVFKNEDVGVGAKFFECIRVNEQDAGRDRVLANAGRSTPRMVFLRPDYTVHSVIEGKELSASKILKAMKPLVGEAYVNNFDKVTKEYKKLLNELDRLEGVKQRIEDSRLRLQGKSDPSAQRKLDAEVKEYEAEMAAWTAKEQKLLDLRKKGEKTPDA